MTNRTTLAFVIPSFVIRHFFTIKSPVTIR